MIEQGKVSVLAARAEWYRSGCAGAKDRHAYLLNELAADAADDLQSALTLLQTSESVRSELAEALNEADASLRAIFAYVTGDNPAPGTPVEDVIRVAERLRRLSENDAVLEAFYVLCDLMSQRKETACPPRVQDRSI